MSVIHLNQPKSPSYEVALDMLKNGNLQYRLHVTPEVEEARRAAQHPSATVVTCSYRFIEPGVITHTNGHGKTFVVTSSGHLPGEVFLASINYGVVHLGTPIVLVTSHACRRERECRLPYRDGDVVRESSASPETFKKLINLEGVKVEFCAGSAAEVPRAALTHDLGTALEILRIPEVRERVAAGTLMIATAFYNDETGVLSPSAKIYAPSKQEPHPGQVVLDEFRLGNQTFQGIYADYRRAGLLDRTSLVAMVLRCSDARGPQELMYHLDFGMIEAIRNAGALIEPNTLRSLAITHRHTGVNLLVIEDHSRCGAVQATRAEVDDGCKPLSIGHHRHLTRRIQPHLTEGHWADAHPLMPDTVELREARNRESVEAARIHAMFTLRDLIFYENNEDADYLRDQIRAGKLRVAVAVSHFGSGAVEFIEGEGLKLLAEWDSAHGRQVKQPPRAVGDH